MRPRVMIGMNVILVYDLTDRQKVQPAHEASPIRRAQKLYCTPMCTKKTLLPEFPMVISGLSMSHT